jgi:hypothetical protein
VAAVVLVSSIAAATDMIAWTYKESLPQDALGFVAGDTLNGAFWVAGGSFSVDFPDFESYDPGTDHWTVRPPMQSARSGCALVALNGKLYAIGGNGGTTCLNSVEKYDPGLNAWSPCTTMFTERYGLAAAGFGATIFVFGGSNAVSQSLNTGEAYDTVANVWWNLPSSIPTARYAARAVALNGLVYVIGGSNATSGYLAQVEAYNPASNTWTTKAALSKKKKWVGACSLGGLIYVSGGFSDNGGYQSQVEVYDPGTDRWDLRDTLRTAREGHAMGAIGRTLYVAGGLTEGYTLNSVEAGTVVTLQAGGPKAGTLQVRNNVINTRVGTIAYLVLHGTTPGGTVRLTVYDVAGRPVQTLLPTTLDGSGYACVQFEAKTRGWPLLGGVYWVVATGAVEDKKPVMVVTWAADAR